MSKKMSPKYLSSTYIMYINKQEVSKSMYIPKKYGCSQSKSCPFCNRNATSKNEQKIPVCEKHRATKFPDVRCSCKSFLDLRDGKWGPYFVCMKCGNKNLQNVLELMQATNQKLQPELEKNEMKSTPIRPNPTSSAVYPRPQPKKEIVISSDDPEWFS